jgi:hypothetical protein
LTIKRRYHPDTDLLIYCNDKILIINIIIIYYAVAATIITTIIIIIIDPRGSRIQNWFSRFHLQIND